MDKKTYTPKERFINREISWLAFNQRVLDEASNLNHPLFERLRFLSISASNLDEFFSVRVAGLITLSKENTSRMNMRGETSGEQLKDIYLKTDELMQNQQKIWCELKKELFQNGIEILSQSDINSEDMALSEEIFLNEVFPLLTPIAIDPAHPFPFLAHQGMALILNLRNKSTEEENNMVIPLPTTLPRFFRLYPDKHKYITLENIIINNLHLILPNHEELGFGLFKILRDTDIEIEEEAEDLVREFETALRRRRRGDVVRLKIMSYTPENLKKIVFDEYELPKEAVFESEYILGMTSLSQLISNDRPELLFPSYQAHMPTIVKQHNGDIFKAISTRDFIVHHPYETFDIVTKFLEQAAYDPDVVAIKLSLYRTSKDSPIVKALVNAAENGKNVTVVVELKARFDEAANIQQARMMERAGVQVVFGFLEWKTHAKIATVMRRENGKLKTYTHMGTGNYHPVTAKIYTDISLFTVNDAYGRDATKIFNYVTGYIEPQWMEVMELAPVNLKETLLSLIENERKNAGDGKPAFIYAKMNALVDPQVIDALYRASQAGVKIFLNIRGVCCLRPNVEGLSDNIIVKSIVGRFLEHSRISIFANGEEYGHHANRVFISSADWMPRNLDRRIETLIPILDNKVKLEFLEQIMPAFFADNTQSWYLDKDKNYVRATPKKKTQAFCVHNVFMKGLPLSFNK